MRVMIKRKLLRLLDTMQSMHKIIAGADIHSADGYVEDCRQASEAIEGAAAELTSGLEAMSALFLSLIHICFIWRGGRRKGLLFSDTKADEHEISTMG